MLGPLIADLASLLADEEAEAVDYIISYYIVLYYIMPRLITLITVVLQRKITINYYIRLITVLIHEHILGNAFAGVRL